MTLDDCKTLEEIENYRVAKLKERQATRTQRNVVRQEKLLTQREIITLNAKKKDLEIAEDKANNIIADLHTEIELAKTRYWQIKE